LRLSRPAAALTGDFNLNGIASTHDDTTLIVAHTANSRLYTVDPVAGGFPPTATQYEAVIVHR
jgi:sugar lactone lactonase YvrE